MLTLRYQRFFAFTLRIPAVPFPFRKNVAPLLKLIGRAPVKREKREKSVRKNKANPIMGMYRVRITNRANKGQHLALRRELFRS